MKSKGLVAAQFALIALLLALGYSGPWRPLSVALALAGIALGLWALTANRPGNFNIRPEPKPGATLVDSGPYRWIRHPMYSAVLLFCAAFAIHAGIWAWAGWIGLAIVLRIKSRIEERALAGRDPRYARYMTRVRAFVPWVF